MRTLKDLAIKDRDLQDPVALEVHLLLITRVLEETLSPRVPSASVQTMR